MRSGSSGTGPPNLTPDQWARVVELRHTAIRMAKRFAAGNRVGLSRDDLSELVEDALIDVVQSFDPDRGRLEAYARVCIRRKVRKAIDKRTREIVPAARAPLST